MSYSVIDFYELYSTSDRIVYFECLTFEEYSRRYLTMRQSLLALLELLYFPFDFNYNAVENLLLIIHKMCDFKQSNIKKYVDTKPECSRQKFIF